MTSAELKNVIRVFWSSSLKNYAPLPDYNSKTLKFHVTYRYDGLYQITDMYTTALYTTFRFDRAVPNPYDEETNQLDIHALQKTIVK